MSHRTGAWVAVAITARSCLACHGLPSASITTTPLSVTTNPAFGRPSDPRPVSPGTAYTPDASCRARYGAVENGGPAAGGLGSARPNAAAASSAARHELQVRTP